MTDRGGKRVEALFKRFVLYVTIAAVLVAVSPLAQDKVFAAAVTSLQDTLQTMEASVNSSHTIQFISPSGVAAGQTITYTFPTGFTLKAEDANNFDFAVSAAGTCASFTDKTLALTASGTTWGVDVTGQVITITSGTDTIATNRCIQLEAGPAATNGATGAADTIANQTTAQNASDAKISIAGTFGDTGTLAVEIVAAADVPIVVNATVDPSLTCSFTGITATFSSLTTGAISTASGGPFKITVSTNAGSGVNITVYDDGNGTNPGLYKSSGTTYLIGSANGAYANLATLAAGTDGFGATASSSGGSGAALTVDGNFDASGGADEVGGFDVGAANADSIAASTGALASRELTIVYKAAVSGLAPAGSYTDNLYYVCTGIF